MTDLNFSHFGFDVAEERLSLQSMRLLSFLLKMFPDNYDTELNPPVLITISVQDFAEYFRLDTKNSYRDVSLAVKNLIESNVFIDGGDNRKELIPIFQSVRYVEGEGKAELEINAAACILLYMRKTLRFEAKHSELILSFSKSYSHLLYGFFLAFDFDKTKSVYLNLEKLKEFFVVGRRYNKFIDFRRRVLDPAIEEVNQKTGWGIQYSKETEGRRVKGITFYFKENVS